MRIAPHVHSSSLFFPLLLFSCSGEKWDNNSCPTDLSAYVGCSLRVDALFESFNRKCSDGNEYSFSIQINDIKGLPEEDVHSVGINGNDSVCNVSGVITDPKVEYQSVAFYAKRASQTTAPIRIHCEDSILVKDGIASPLFSNILMMCNGILFEWIGPDLLPGFKVLGYTLFIGGTDITIKTTNTSLVIPYDGLEYNEEYNVSLSASYCAGQGNETFETFVTATAPQVDNDVGKTIVHIQNHRNATVILVNKVANPGCSVSYPTSVTIHISCDSENTIMETRPVQVRKDDDTIKLILELRVDKVCSGTLMWENQNSAVSTTKVNPNTNQLQHCSFWIERDEIFLACVYADGSTLWGCRGVAVHEATGRHYAKNITSRFGGGDIGAYNLCTGVYRVTCYGLIRPTSGVISYSGSLYSDVLTVTSGPNCTTSNPSTASSVTVTTSVIVPTAAALNDYKSETAPFVVAVAVLSVVTVLLCGITIVLGIYIVALKFPRERRYRLPLRVQDGQRAEENELTNKKKSESEQQRPLMQESSFTDQAHDVSGPPPSDDRANGGDFVSGTRYTRVEGTVPGTDPRSTSRPSAGTDHLTSGMSDGLDNGNEQRLVLPPVPPKQNKTNPPQEQLVIDNLDHEELDDVDTGKAALPKASNPSTVDAEKNKLTQPPLSDLNQPSIPSPALQTPPTDLASVPASDENKTGSMKEQTDDQSQATPTPQDLASKHDAGGINPESSQDKQTNSTDDKESLPKSESLHSVHQPLQVQQQKSNEDKKYVY